MLHCTKRLYVGVSYIFRDFGSFMVPLHTHTYMRKQFTIDGKFTKGQFLSSNEKVLFNSHDTAGIKCVEIVKTLHVKFFPFAFPLPLGIVTVKD